MKHIFYSEKLNKNFESEEACIKAEQEYDDARIAEQERKNTISKKKKELSDKIAAADKVIDEKYKNYDLATERASDIMCKARQESDAIIREAVVEVEKATESRMNLIKEFNEQFGPYTTQYTGDRALYEYNKVLRYFKDIFRL